ncbi:hypothetical protein P3W33_00960 [Luteibacter sp. PPL552]
MTEAIELSRKTRIVVLVALAAITALIYANGLSGPFLIDDVPNLDTVQRWVQGRLDWRAAIDNRSGPLGRSVTMLTFLFDAARSGGMYAETFKTTNLGIHILCGLLVYTLCRQLFRRAEATRDVASRAALFVAACWLFLPIHVSTVLYIVQRMAQLGALFSLLALVAYISIRERMERFAGKLAVAALWIMFPVIVGIGALAKENAVLAVPLAALVEVTMFGTAGRQRRPLAVSMFFAMTLVLPTMIGVAWLVAHPEIIAGGYQTRSFTLSERLLTEPRVLWSYVKTMLLPVGRDMGLFHDNYPVSTSWISPWTTWLAIVGLAVAITTAVSLRRRQPLVTLGIGFFLIGHALESTIVPLELYFEHRNYLPDVGVLIALTGGFRALWIRYRTITPGFRRIALISLPVLLALYASATWVETGNWSNADTLFDMQEAYNPTSARLQDMLAARAVERKQVESALRHLDLAERFGAANEAMTSSLWRMIVYCTAGKPIPEPIYAQFEQRIRFPITQAAMRYWEQLAQLSEGGCPDPRRVAQAGRRWIDHDSSPPTAQVKWRSRYNLARMEAAGGDLVQAVEDADRAWRDSDHNNGIGILLFQLNASLGRRNACEAVLRELRKSRGSGNADLDQAVDLFTKALADGTVGAAPSAAPR